MTSTGEPTRSQRRTSIRTKLLVGLAVPVLFVALISGFQANKAQGDLNRTKDEVTLAMAAGGPTTYITALLDERNMSALEILDLTDVVTLDRVDDMAQARELTDEAQAEFERSLSSGGPEVQALYRETYDDVRENLGALRAEIDAIPEEDRSTDMMEEHQGLYDKFSVLAEQFHTANTVAVAEVDDARLRNRAAAIAAYTRSSDLLSLMSRTAAMSFLADSPDDRERMARRLEMQDRKTRYDRSQEQAVAALAGDPSAQEVMAGFYTRPEMDEFYDGIATFIEDGEIPAGQVQGLIASAANTAHPNGTDAWQAARTSLQQRGDSLVSSAQTTRNWYVAIFVLATLVSLALALLISRSIGRPLMSIASQAEDMARKNLPAAVGSILSTPLGQDIVEPELDPIEVSSRDEVADVAASINLVQQRALDLAVDQAAQRRNFADTFLNLGRRVQGLVARQLDFITELEAAEDDPEVLDDLFRLDHLATRMRRNAESLVVLAGVTRRQRRGRPAPVVDALRSALSEVDQYTRVEIGDVDHARLPMSVAADLAHILAELIENGLNFSPPETNVEVIGRRSDSGYEVIVIDHGIGMDADQVATANRRLSGQESFTVAPSRYMGHYVAGHLATNLGLAVTLSSSAAGTRAVVSVPNDLLVTREDTKFATDDDADTLTVRPTAPTPTTDEPSPRAEPPAAAPARPPAGPGPGRSESLGSLLAVHRRLSRTTTSTARPDLSPWAARQDLERPAPESVPGSESSGESDGDADDSVSDAGESDVRDD